MLSFNFTIQLLVPYFFSLGKLWQINYRFTKFISVITVVSHICQYNLKAFFFFFHVLVERNWILTVNHFFLYSLWGTKSYFCEGFTNCGFTTTTKKLKQSPLLRNCAFSVWWLIIRILGTIQKVTDSWLSIQLHFVSVFPWYVGLDQVLSVRQCN